MVKNWKLFPLRSGIDKDVYSPTTVQHSTGSHSCSDQKDIMGILVGKEVKCYSLVYIHITSTENPKDFTEKLIEQ